MAQVQGVKGSDIYTPETVGDPRVVLSNKCVRGATGDDLRKWMRTLLTSASDAFLRDAVVLAFQVRDVRGGRGERDAFYELFRELYAVKPHLALELLGLVPEYGCWRDLFHFAAEDPELRVFIFGVVEKQLEADEAALARGEVGKLSLLAKWAPREGNRQDALAKQLARWLVRSRAEPVPAQGIFGAYRKRMAALNRALQTVETYECSGRWDEIDPKRVPGRARQLKLSAYLNEKRGSRTHELRHPDDPKRMACREHFKTYLAAAAAGTQRVTGTDTVFPHELVHRFLMNPAATTDEANAWNALWTQIAGKATGLGSSIAMCDFSGSMGLVADKDSARNVSLAMGLLIASVGPGPFRGRFLTFDSTPRWAEIPADGTLQQQIAAVRTNALGQGLSTDFQKAMDLVLDTLKAQRVRPGEEPKNLIVLTDMGWDQACRSDEASTYTGNRYANIQKTKPWQTHISMIRAAFKQAGEDLWGEGGGWTPPRIVIWNLSASYTNDFHAKADEEGVIMLAGWSAALFRVLCEEGPKVLTPLQTLRAQLDDKRYDPVRAVVAKWMEGGWRAAF